MADESHNESAVQQLERMGVPFSEETFLQYVARGDDLVVDLFIKAGIRVSAKNADGESALLSAVRRGKIEIAKKLISAGADTSQLLQVAYANATNDSPTLRSSYIFVQRFFEKKYAKLNLKLPDPKTRPLFEWVLLTHAHGDHAEGLKRLLKGFGARRFWYPNTKLFQPAKRSAKLQRPVYLAALLRFVKRSQLVRRYRALDTQSKLPKFGNVDLKVLWPPASHNSSNENNNSVVMALTLGKVSFVLTDDAEADVWNLVPKGQSDPLHKSIPSGTEFFKVPHHGAENGMFVAGGLPQTPWLDALSSDAKLGISSHVQPFPHPSQSVVDEIKNRNLNCYRTDQHYHVTRNSNPFHCCRTCKS